jgi:3',5'-cyclic AMP phosphodiesterase CpdA
MADGSEQEFSKDDVMLLPPGHDAWTVGHEPFAAFAKLVLVGGARTPGSEPSPPPGE